MSITATKLYKCPNCASLYEVEDEAINCCYDGEIKGWSCDECGELYEDKEEARECCK